MIGLYEGKIAEVVRVKDYQIGSLYGRMSGKFGTVLDIKSTYAIIAVGTKSSFNGWAILHEDYDIVGRLKITKVKTAKERAEFRKRFN